MIDEVAEPRVPWVVDSHCHLDQAQFGSDRHEVLVRARIAGVGAFVNPGVDLESSRAAVALAASERDVFAAVGVHPNDCADFDSAALEQIRTLARQPKVVAIGEIGLDYHWHDVSPAQQKMALRAQLTLATQLDLPVVLHSRDATGDLLCELSQWRDAVRNSGSAREILGVLHAFSGDLSDAEKAYELGLVIGIGGPVTFRNSHLLRSVVPRLRIDRLVLETDAPYLAPHPHRGQRNEPALLPLVLAALADLIGVSPSSLAEHCSATSAALFRRDELNGPGA
jgi:TatD DNase family protein